MPNGRDCMQNDVEGCWDLPVRNGGVKKTPQAGSLKGGESRDGKSGTVLIFCLLGGVVSVESSR